MSDEMLALAQRAVACKGWRWLPGMLTQFGRAVEDGADVVVRGRCHGEPPAAGDALPDLTDPATLGCLLALVREAWSDSEAYTRTQPRGGASVWAVCIKTVGAQIQRGPAMNTEGDMLYGPTEAHALVAALEAAP